MLVAVAFTWWYQAAIEKMQRIFSRLSRDSRIIEWRVEWRAVVVTCTIIRCRQEVYGEGKSNRQRPPADCRVIDLGQARGSRTMGDQYFLSI